MSTPGWRTALVVHGLTRAGRSVPVVVGLVAGANGGVFVALRVDDSEPVILPVQASSQHIVNIREVLLERLRVVGDKLGDES